MSLSADTIKKQLNIVKPLLESCSLEMCRLGQNKLGDLKSASIRKHLLYKEQKFDTFEGVWAIPKDERRQGVILYLHGGGYTSGGVEYARAFASTLAFEFGTKVFAPGYRLAPENKFPTALDDAVEAYIFLLAKGFAPEHITLCGESAGGGLCYSLCQRLKDMGHPLPCSIIAISPWTDLTLSGKSYNTNKDSDPTLSRKTLKFYADCYCDDKENPMVSPLFSELDSMPPSLIFVGGDEILLDDSVLLHKKLLKNGSKSKLIIAPERWHAYVLFNLEENRDDYKEINKFLNKHMAAEKRLQWFRLDNAAKIYPAARHRNWSNVFRLSASLKEDIDVNVLKSALDVTARRFPSMAVRLRRGAFWYYLEQLQEAPDIRSESSYPLSKMHKKETRQCAMRVIAYKNRIAVECFHSLTDGTGALTFLKTLTAEYLEQRYNIEIPFENGILDRLEEPCPEELEDSFLKHAGKYKVSRSENTAWHITGTPEKNDFLNLTCFKVPVKDVIQKAHEYNATLTEFLCSVLMKALENWQNECIPIARKRRPVKVLIPVNLRNLFKSKTMRNFALYTTPEIDTRLGEHSFEEILSAVHHKMGLEVNPKYMQKRITTNVNDEKSLIVKIMPLFIKNAVMKAVFSTVGECKSCLAMSNLGNIKLPDSMAEYIERFDFILGVQSSAPHNCGIISFNNTVYINFIRNIVEADLERHFFEVLRDMGLTVTVESNASSKEEKNVLY